MQSVWGAQLEVIDEFLAIEIFLGMSAMLIAAVSLAVVLLQQVEAQISTVNPNFGTPRHGLVDRKSRLNLVKGKFIIALYLAVIGLFSSVLFDGALEFRPEYRQEFIYRNFYFDFLDVWWPDLIEAFGSSAFLFLSILFFLIGVRQLARIEFGD